MAKWWKESDKAVLSPGGAVFKAEMELSDASIPDGKILLTVHGAGQKNQGSIVNVWFTQAGQGWVQLVRAKAFNRKPDRKMLLDAVSRLKQEAPKEITYDQYRLSLLTTGLLMQI